MRRIMIFVIAASLFFCQRASASSQGRVSLLTDVQPSLAMILSNTNINFGMMTSGSPDYGGHGVDIAVSTNSANGYYLAIADNVEGRDSALLHSDGKTRIADFGAGIDRPENFLVGVSTGLGVSLYQAQTWKEAKWGNGKTYDDSHNNYAGIPMNSTVFHQAPGYKNFVDHSYISFILDVPSNQKTGQYRGIVVLSSTCMLN